MINNISGLRKQSGGLNRRSRIFRILYLLLIFTITWGAAPANQRTEVEINSRGQSRVISRPSVTLQAATGATISFKTQNGNSLDHTPPQKREIPYLVLFRNSRLTKANERTVIITVNNLAVPPAGLTVSLTLETQHGDPDQDGGTDERIAVWSETHRFDNSIGVLQTGVTTIFEVEFDEAIHSSGGLLTTPTDYYRYKIEILQGSYQDQSTDDTITQDYALLIENQSIAKLRLDTKGPREIVLYYCDMFPFQKNVKDASTRRSREGIPDYVQSQLMPAMLTAIQTQASWGFSWDEAWTNQRTEENPKRLSVALTDGMTWFHGRAPRRGHAGIAINTNGGNNADYDTLTDGIMSTFHHELFHTFQRSINQANGGDGDVDGKDNAWQFFSEGTASLVPSVAQADVQYSQSGEPRAYLAKATKFVGGRGFPGELNNSYEDINPYRAAIYWRFLYEQCGGIRGDEEDSVIGMGLIRRSLEALYSKEVVDIDTATNLVEVLPLIMDKVLSSPEAAACPFTTYEESLSHFASSIYALHLDQDQCRIPESPSRCGFYDPNNLYSRPNVSELTFFGQEIVFGGIEQPHPSGIRSSFGMDFIDLILDPDIQGEPLTIEIFGDPQENTMFAIQVWKLIDTASSSGKGSSLSVTSAVDEIDREKSTDPYLYRIPAVELEKYNRLGLIITRLDNHENQQTNGTYTIVLRSE